MKKLLPDDSQKSWLNEERLRLLLNSTAEGIFSVDLEYRCTFCNAAGLRLLGYEQAAEMIGEEMHSLIAHSRADGKPYPIEECPAARSLQNATAAFADGDVFWKKDGTNFPVEYRSYPMFEDGTHIGAVVTFSDITGRKVAEESLRLSEERFAKAFQASPEPISIFRHADGVLLEVNDRWVANYGYTREEAIGSTTAQLGQVDPADRERLRELLEKQQAVRDFEINLKTKAGTIRHINLSAEQIVINGERCNIFLHNDITESRRAEEKSLKLIHVMGERVKELTTLHKTARILQDERKTISQLLEEIVALIPSGWQHPEIAAARISFGDVAFHTANFVATAWSQLVEFTAAGVQGAIEVVYLEERPAEDEGPFLDEERNLIKSLAEMLSTALNHRYGQEELRESQRRFSDTLINLNMIAVMVDVDGNITFCNDYLLRLTGWERDDAIGHNWFEIFLPDHERKKVRDLLDNALPSGEVTPQFENEIVTRSGERRLVKWTNTTLRDPDGNLAGIAALGDDITEHKRMERELTTSEEKYRDLVENALDIIYTHDLGGTYTSINKAGERITGYERDEAVGMNLRQLIAPEFLELSRQMIANKLAGTDETVYDLEIISKSGLRVAVEVNTRLVSHDGVPIAVQGIARDVTERRLLEEQLRQSQKLESVGQLAGGIAHDFNNMLTAINGYSALILRKLAPDDPLRPNVEEIKKAGERSALLTQQLLAFSRKQIMQPRIIDLNSIVTGIEKMLRRLIGEDIDLKTKLPSKLGSVKADPGQIEQVILNLVVNARDSMPRGGKLTIETKNVYLDNEHIAQHVVAKEGHYVLLAVQDEGIGMDDEICKRIFEPFYTTKAVGKGTGLGLSTVYGIVKQSDGYIRVESEPGNGTTFRVYLPLVDEGAQEYITNSRDDLSFRGSETILLVEDEDTVRHVTCDLLKTYGYIVLTAADGPAAFSICKNHEGRIDLLIADVVMPETSGPELAGNLLVSRPYMKVLHISGYADDMIAHHGVLDSDINFLQKPFTPDALARKVRGVIDQAKT